MFAEELLLKGTPVLVAGVSVVGERGQIVYAASILKAVSFSEEGGEKKISDCKGWCYFQGHTRLFRNGLRYLDTRTWLGKRRELAIPNTIIHVAAEVDPSLAEKASKKEVREVINWALAQIDE